MQIFLIVLTIAMTIVGAERLSKNNPNKAGLGALILLAAFVPAFISAFNPPYTLLPAIPFLGLIIGGAILVSKPVDKFE